MSKKKQWTYKNNSNTNKKTMSKFNYFFIALSIISFLVFWLIKLLNSAINNDIGLTSVFLISFGDFNLNLSERITIAELIDWVANFNIIILFPICILITIILTTFSFLKKEKEDIKLLPFKEKYEDSAIKLITYNNDNAPIILEHKSSQNIEKSVAFISELETKYSNILTSEIKDDVTNMSTQERTNLDGSISIIESRHQLLKHASRLRIIAELLNVQLLKINLRNLTKKELIIYMKQVTELISYSKMTKKGETHD